jgi:pimeloyl-ACP methyl ester carboxylesterase
MNIQFDGENIYYKDVGTASKTIVLLHNAGGSHQFFHHQIEVLQKNYRVIAMDLPGHGKSAALHREYSLARLAGVVSQFCAKLNLSSVTLIGLNNGANLAIEIADQGRLALKALVLIDPPLFLEPAFIAEINQFIMQLNSADYERFVEKMVANLLPNNSAVNTSIATHAFLAVGRNVLAALFFDLMEWDKSSFDKVKNLNMPTLAILTDGHHCSREKLQACHAGIDIQETIGSRCWATLDEPAQVNKMVDQFLEEYV